MYDKEIETQKYFGSQPTEFTPAPFMVYATSHPTARNGLRAPHTSRIGAAKTVEKAKELIADDRRAMGQTFGGLITASGDANREYHVFRAEWTRVEL